MKATFALWFAQRVSGAVLALLVLVHLVTMIAAVRGGLSGAEILQRFGSSAAWPAFYALFVLSAALHAPIGLRNIALEYRLTSEPVVNGLAVLVGVSLLGLGGYAVVSLMVATAGVAAP